MPTPAPLDTPALARSLDRQYVIGLCCMAVLIIAFPLYRIGEPARRRRARAAMERESVTQGRESFARNCAGCHGANAGGGAMAPTLGSREFLSTVTDQQLHWLIAGGIPGTPMSAYHLDLGGPFTPQEIDRLVRYLRSLEPTAPSVPNWRASGRAEHHEAPHTPDRDARQSPNPRHVGRVSPDSWSLAPRALC